MAGVGVISAGMLGVGCSAAGPVPPELSSGDPVVISYSMDGTVRWLLRIFDDGAGLMLNGANCAGGQLPPEPVEKFRSSIGSEDFRRWFAGEPHWDGSGSCSSAHDLVFQVADQTRLLPCGPIPEVAGYGLAQLANQLRQGQPAGPLSSETSLPQIEVRRVVAGNLAEASLLIESTGKVIRRLSDGTNETGTMTRPELDAVRLIVRYPRHDHGDPMISDGYEVTIGDQPPVLVAAPDKGDLPARRPELAAIVMIADRTA